MPGANARALDKARGLDADVLILDLEDAVAPDASSQARAQWRPPCRPAATADANAWRASTRWTRRGDWTTRAPSPPPAPTPCCCPRSKARPSWTRWRGHWTRRRARRPSLVGHVRNAVGLSASGRHRRPSPAGGPGRGHVGPGQDLHARHTPGREETLLARSLAIMAARAHGLAALDGVHLDLTMTRAWRAGLRARPQPGLRRQDADSSAPDRRRQRGLCAQPRGDRRRAQAVAGLARCPGQRPGRRGGRRFAGGKPARARSRTRAGAGRCHRRRLSARRARPHPYRRASPATALPRRPGTIRFLTRTTPRCGGAAPGLRRAVPRARRLRPEPHALHPATRAVSRAAVPRPPPFPLRP